jgi:hypothetical protein
MEGAASAGHHTCGVLTTVLQDQQPVVEQLINR